MTRNTWREAAITMSIAFLTFTEDRPWWLMLLWVGWSNVGGYLIGKMLTKRDLARQDRTMREIIVFLRRKAFDADAEIYGLVRGAVEVMEAVPLQDREPRLSDHMDMQLRLAASNFENDPAYKQEWSPARG